MSRLYSDLECSDSVGEEYLGGTWVKNVNFCEPFVKGHSQWSYGSCILECGDSVKIPRWNAA